MTALAVQPRRLGPEPRSAGLWTGLHRGQQGSSKRWELVVVPDCSYAPLGPGQARAQLGQPGAGHCSVAERRSFLSRHLISFGKVSPNSITNASKPQTLTHGFAGNLGLEPWPEAGGLLEFRAASAAVPNTISHLLKVERKSGV